MELWVKLAEPPKVDLSIAAPCFRVKGREACSWRLEDLDDGSPLSKLPHSCLLIGARRLHLLGFVEDEPNLDTCSHPGLQHGHSFWMVKAILSPHDALLRLTQDAEHGIMYFRTDFQEDRRKVCVKKFVLTRRRGSSFRP